MRSANGSSAGMVFEKRRSDSNKRQPGSDTGVETMRAESTNFSTRKLQLDASLIRSRRVQCFPSIARLVIFAVKERLRIEHVVPRSASLQILRQLAAVFSPSLLSSPFTSCIRLSFVGTRLALAQCGNYLTKPIKLLVRLDHLRERENQLSFTESNHHTLRSLTFDAILGV